MTVETEEATVPNPGRKQSKRERFRDRLLKKPDKAEKAESAPGDHAEREESLDDFFRSPSDGDVLPSFPSPYRNPVPRINISSSSRWPDAQKVLQSLKSAGRGEDGTKIVFEPSTSRPKKNKGLVVRFADGAPQIIGEGGEAAQAPTMSIAQEKDLSSAHGSRDDGPNPIPDNFTPRPLVRVATGMEDRSTAREDSASALSQGDEAAAQTAVRADSGSLNPSSAGLRRRMREEEGRAFTTGLRDPSPEPPFPERHSSHKQDPDISPALLITDSNEHERSSSIASSYLAVSSPLTSRPSTPSRHSDPAPSKTDQSQDLRPASSRAAWSMTSSPQRKPLAKHPAPELKEDALAEFPLYRVSSSLEQSHEPEPASSRAARASTASPQRRPPSPQRRPLARKPDPGTKEDALNESPLDHASSSLEHPREPEPVSNRAARAGTASPQRRPLVKTPNPEPNEDALNEFRLRARRYYSIFALAAEKMQHGPDVSLSKWIRAATWWFLVAETSFKLLKKDLQGGVDISQILSSRRLAQATVDLAKTAWIVEDMVRDYADREALDLSSPASVDLLIQSDPQSRFSRTLQYRQELFNRLGSLAAAVQRSGFMSLPPGEVPLSAGIDSTIWLTHSVTDPSISQWFRAASPPWVHMDDSVVPEEPSDLANVVPLKSSSKMFRIRSMFCHVAGNFRNHHPSPSIPCVLTISRRSGSYALVLSIASQDHGVNVVIETDPIRGDGMEWQHSILSVMFNFADSFQFSIRFQQADYAQFTETYDLALRALTAAGQNTSRTANPGERLIFRATSKTFERKSNHKVSTFAYEGDQRDCEIFLFERYAPAQEVSSSRRAARWLGLKVLLSPLSPNLGVLDVNIGGDKPILLDVLADQSPPRIEILEMHRASLNFQFSRHKDFDRFYDILASPDHSLREDLVESMSLHSFSVEPSSAQAQVLLRGAKWKQLQIWTGQNRSNENIASPPPINICASSKEMVIADKLPRGPSQIRFGLRVSSPTSLSLWHVPHQDTSMILRYRSVSPDAPVMADQLLASLKQSPTTHNYTFASQSDLHTFQKHLSGSQVLFDGVASSFAVTRGTGLRTKKDELGTGRLQLLHSERGQHWQMVAFFDTGQATAFPIDTTDTFEKSHSGGSGSKGKHCIRLVEARISLSQLFEATRDRDGKGENPTEPPQARTRTLLSFPPADESDQQGASAPDADVERHDVTITFETEETQDLLAQVLPTPVVKKTGSVFRGALHLR